MNIRTLQTVPSQKSLRKRALRLARLFPMEKFCAFPSFGDNLMPFSVTLKEPVPVTY